MEIINEITKLNKYVGEKTVLYINEHLNPVEKNNLFVCTNKDELLVLCYEYGILPMLRYLYEGNNVPYNFKLLTNTNVLLSSDTNDFCCSVESGGCNTKLSITFGGKHQYGKKFCYNYLEYMRRYSMYVSKNKQFYYKYNYTTLLNNEIVDKMTDTWIENQYVMV